MSEATEIAKNKKHDELTKIAEGKRCAKCQTLLQVAWIQGEWKIRCECFPDLPIMETVKPEGERLGRIVGQAMVKATSEEQIKALSEQTIQQYICPLATKQEAYLFLKLCQALSLNPFVGEAYLIKYDQKARAAFVIGVQAHLKWASRNPDYAGYESGIIITTKDVVTGQAKPEYRDGALLLEGEKLVGGWCKVHNRKWQATPLRTVSLSEYDRHQSLWKEKPATMIEKVAINQGHRRAFPEDVGYIYQIAQQQAKAEGLPVEEVEGDDVMEGVIVPPTEEKDQDWGPMEESAKQARSAPAVGAATPASPETAQTTPTFASKGDVLTYYTKPPHNLTRVEIETQLGKTVGQATREELDQAVEKAIEARKKG